MMGVEKPLNETSKNYLNVTHPKEEIYMLEIFQ
jgi:hypothetical protein